MILLLGKNDMVEMYAREVLKLDLNTELACYPFSVTTHYTELPYYIEKAKDEKPFAITTQNLELIDIFLSSDLDFDVITVYGLDRIRSVSKALAMEIRNDFGLELR